MSLKIGQRIVCPECLGEDDCQYCDGYGFELYPHEPCEGCSGYGVCPECDRGYVTIDAINIGYFQRRLARDNQDDRNVAETEEF